MMPRVTLESTGVFLGGLSHIGSNGSMLTVCLPGSGGTTRVAQARSQTLSRGGSFLGGVDLPRGVWGHAPPALKIFQILLF